MSNTKQHRMDDHKPEAAVPEAVPEALVQALRFAARRGRELRRDRTQITPPAKDAA